MQAQLPSLLALRYLEAVVRHQSLTAAARELGVTQSAISKQMRQLEEELGYKLLSRTSTGVEPLPAAVELAASMAASLTMLRATIARWHPIDTHTEPTSTRQSRAQILIGVPPSFATHWLAPRQGAFRSRHPSWSLLPDVSLKKHDLAAGPVSLCIRYGLGGYEDVQWRKLSHERLVAVCVPDLLGANLEDIELLQAYTPSSPRSNEPALLWAAAARVALTRDRITFNRQSTAVIAALQGEGVAIVPYQLVRDAIRARDLSLYSNASCVDELSYHLVWNSERVDASLLAAVDAWLCEEFEERDEAAGERGV